MAEALRSWLSGLAPAALVRIGRNVLADVPPQRDRLELALAERLGDDQWLEGAVEGLPERELRALKGLVSARVPVLRNDLHGLASAGEDPIDHLEDRGLVTAVRTGRGMPTHVSVTPGLDERLRRLLEGATAMIEAPATPEHAARKRRFDLALLVSELAQHPPRLTRNGQLHTADVTRISERLAGTFASAPSRLEKLVAQFLDHGAITPLHGRIEIVPAIACDVDRLHLRLALAELAAPSFHDAAKLIVQNALKTGPVSLTAVIREAQADLLRSRSELVDAARMGVKRELADTLHAVLDSISLLVLARDGTPLTGATADEARQKLARGEDLLLALDPVVGAALLGVDPLIPRPGRGFVQGSFEVVADASCPPDAVAQVGLVSELVRADHAAVFQITRDSVLRAAQLGIPHTDCLAAFERLSGQPTPANVARLLGDWHAAAGPASTPAAPLLPPTPFETLLREAREAVGVAAPAHAP